MNRPLSLVGVVLLGIVRVAMIGEARFASDCSHDSPSSMSHETAGRITFFTLTS